MEFLNKNFIYINNSLITIPILFIKKFNKGLYFYINYYILNTFIRKNYYLLLLIKETLNSFNKTK